LAGKSIEVTTKIGNPSGGFNISIVEYDGTGDPNKVLLGWNNDAPIVGANMKVSQTYMIPENNNFQQGTLPFTVPVGAKRFGVMIYPVTEASPCHLSLQQFDISATEPFNHYRLVESVKIAETRMAVS